MGSKGKPNTPKGKKPIPTQPELNPDEMVTELEKEFFEFQLGDIEKKINRIDAREEELKAETLEIEEKIEEFKKEKGAIVDEYEQVLVAKEEEKVQKRQDMLYLSEEIKVRVEKHKKHIQELEEKFQQTITDLTEQIEVLEKEVQLLEEYKFNRESHTEKHHQIELQIEEEEMQHQRNLFKIEKKSEMAIGSVKKELQSKLLQLSIEFRETSQMKIGKPCHRASQENKAIQNVLVEMQEEINEYEEKSKNSRNNMMKYKSQKDEKLQENDKMIARTVIQLHVIKNLLKNRFKLWEKLKTFEAVDVENKNLIKKYNTILSEMEKKTKMIESVRQSIDEKTEDTNMMKETIKYLKRSWKRLQVLTRNALKIAEEALVVRLIPLGGMEEEKFMSMDAKIRLFKKRRDTTYAKRGRILQYLLEFLSKGQMSEEDKKILTASVETIGLRDVNFSVIYGKIAPPTERDLEARDSQLEEEVEKGPLFFTSLTSLMRSVSAVLEPGKHEGEDESYEGEFEEYGEVYEVEGEGEERENERLEVKEETETEVGEPGQEQGDENGGEKSTESV